MTYDGKFYAPGRLIGMANVTDVQIIRYRLGMLTVPFTEPQNAPKNYEFNRYGLFAQIKLRTKGDARKALASFLAALYLWENGERLDRKQIWADEKRCRQRSQTIPKNIGSLHTKVEREP